MISVTKGPMKRNAVIHPYFHTIEHFMLPPGALLSYDWYDSGGNKYTLMLTNGVNVLLPGSAMFL